MKATAKRSGRGFGLDDNNGAARSGVRPRAAPAESSADVARLAQAVIYCLSLRRPFIGFLLSTPLKFAPHHHHIGHLFAKQALHSLRRLPSMRVRWPN